MCIRDSAYLVYLCSTPWWPSFPPTWPKTYPVVTTCGSPRSMYKRDPHVTVQQQEQTKGWIASINSCNRLFPQTRYPTRHSKCTNQIFTYVRTSSMLWRCLLPWVLFGFALFVAFVLLLSLRLEWSFFPVCLPWQEEGTLLFIPIVFVGASFLLWLPLLPFLALLRLNSTCNLTINASQKVTFGNSC